MLHVTREAKDKTCSHLRVCLNHDSFKEEMRKTLHSAPFTEGNSAENRNVFYFGTPVVYHHID